jgi:hypothetical protein
MAKPAYNVYTYSRVGHRYEPYAKAVGPSSDHFVNFQRDIAVPQTAHVLLKTEMIFLFWGFYTGARVSK